MKTFKAGIFLKVSMICVIIAGLTTFLAYIAPLI